MSTRILLLRHGEIKANRHGRWHGSTDSPLTFWGRRQARQAGKYFKQKPIIVDALYSSPLQRCVQTAKLVTRHQSLHPVELPGLAEMSIGEWENETFDNLNSEYNLIREISRDPDFTPPQGESVAAVSARVCSALRELAANHGEDETVLVVSHGVALGIALATLLHNEPCRWVDYRIANCAFTELELDPSPAVLHFNQHPYL